MFKQFLGTNKLTMKILMTVPCLSLVLMPLLVASCSDDPGAENYYTSRKEYAATFLKNRSETFSEFLKILDRATGEKGTYRLVDLLGTYGSYTVFAPTNAAIDAFLKSKGVSSVEELSKEDCDTLALNHIIEQEFFTTDFSNGTYPQANMLDRFLTITSDSDTISVPGQVKLMMRINKSAVISQADDSVMNGVVHVVSTVIGTRNSMVPDVLKDDSTITLFYNAIRETGLDRMLQENYIDEDYENSKSVYFDKDSTDWTNDKLCITTGLETDNVAYMKHRYNKFTVFVEQDDVLKEKYGVETLEDLNALAHQLYDPMYPDDKDNNVYTDPNNALNRFIAYHILPFQSTYYQLTSVDGPNSTLATMFNRRKQDICDWYETCAPHSLMKFSFPSGTETGLYINRRGVMTRPDDKGVKIRGAKVATPDMMPDNMAVNGIYYYIDDVIAYDATTQNQIIAAERLRMDATTLSPDFLTSGARGHYTASTIENGKYGLRGQGTKAATNVNHCLGFKGNFTKNFVFSDNITHLHVRNKVLSFWSFEGDEVTVYGRFDITIKMPPVPEGEWEVRMFSCLNFVNRGIVQFYFGPGKLVNGKVIGDLQPCGIPVDMRVGGANPRVGWKSDSDLGDADAIATFDKAFRNRGWMKGMACYSCSQGDDGSGTGSQWNRDVTDALRKIITQFHSDGKSDYWLRCQQKLESETGTMAFDALELCPSSVYNNEYYPENKW